MLYQYLVLRAYPAPSRSCQGDILTIEPSTAKSRRRQRQERLYRPTRHLRRHPRPRLIARPSQPQKQAEMGRQSHLNGQHRPHHTRLLASSHGNAAR